MAGEPSAEAITQGMVMSLVVSALIGGLIAAFFKLTFDVLLGEWITYKREVKRLVNQYKIPIVSASDALAGRIGNYLGNIDKDWLTSSEYYRLSTLYAFCTYFAWVEILTGRISHLRMSTSNRNKTLYRSLALINKTLNNSEYFSKGKYSRKDFEHSALPKYLCKALGELVIIEDKNERHCMSFIDFCEKSKTNTQFIKWLADLETFLLEVKDEYGNIAWDRLHLIELSLFSLNQFLDPKHLHSSKIKTDTINTILERIREPYAVECLKKDVSKRNLPLHAENIVSRIKRKLNYKQLRFRRYNEFKSDEVVIKLSIPDRSFESKRGRFKFYKKVHPSLLAETKTLGVPYGVRIRVKVEVPDTEVPYDLLDRLPDNIARFSNGMTKKQWVSLSMPESS